MDPDMHSCGSALRHLGARAQIFRSMSMSIVSGVAMSIVSRTEFGQHLALQHPPLWRSF